jgi:hypothetical protein
MQTEVVEWAALALSTVMAVLLALLVGRLGRIEKRLRTLMSGAGPNAEGMTLGQLVASQGARLDHTISFVETLRHDVSSLETNFAATLQCVGLVRYNPFEETGGDQSFALALLDRRGDGVVISSLHGRAATRFYAKPVRGGSSTLSLSDEEVQAVQQAMSSIQAKPQAK